MESEVKDLCRKLKPVLGKQIDSLWLAYNTQTDSRSRAEIIGMLYSLASEYLDETYDKKILLSFPEKAVINGEYRLGKVVYGDRKFYSFGLWEDEWLRHIGIFGTTGSGKTNCAFITAPFPGSRRRSLRERPAPSNRTTPCMREEARG